MTGPRLYGPFQFTEPGIDAHVQSNSPGVYTLGSIRNDRFLIGYVGRADVDLRTGLKTHLAGAYQQFKFAYALSAKDAFERQCELYHEYVGLDNQCHPCPPSGMNLLCPWCRTLLAP
ncbi:MAG: hypothetical protein LAP40_16390 [Acidobacteriia bacterium]|nr:hypothetical protein [Terriglobia bacterium]